MSDGVLQLFFCLQLALSNRFFLGKNFVTPSKLHSPRDNTKYTVIARLLGKFTYISLDGIRITQDCTQVEGNGQKWKVWQLTGQQFVYFALEYKTSTSVLAIKLEMFVGWFIETSGMFQLSTECPCYASEIASFSKEPEIHSFHKSLDSVWRLAKASVSVVRHVVGY